MLRKRNAFTLIELLVVIAIIAILAAILFPVFLKVRENGKRASCSSNMRQLGMSIRLYQQDFNGEFPGSATYKGAPWEFFSWVSWIQPYVKNKRVFNCPTAVQPWSAGPERIRGGYAYNEYINYRGYGFTSEAQIPRPSQVLLLADGYRYALTHDWNDDDMANLDKLPSGMNRIRYADGVWRGKPTARHSGPNVLFCDGHVESIDKEKFRAENFPGVNYPDTCKEWPIMYPKAKSLRN